MPILRRFAAIGLATLLLLPLTACLGGREGRPASSAAGAFPLQVSPGALSIPAGGGGRVAVSTIRLLPHETDYQGPLTLALEAPPAGVTGSGRIDADRATGTLSLWVDPAMAPQTLRGLRVRATGGGLTAEASFDLTIAPPLPPGQIRADVVQASGGLQQGGTLANSPVVQEPVAATAAADAAQVEALRHGFLPSGSTH